MSFSVFFGNANMKVLLRTEDIRLEQFYSFFLIELKKRNPINKELFAAVPYELKFLVYFMNFKPKDYDALAQFLQK